MKLKNSTSKFKDLSLEIDKLRVPNHIAVIMDGNGRWGVNKGLTRSHGHNEGVFVLKNIIKLSKKLGIKVLTVYAFSTENWTRPLEEVNFLLNLFKKVLDKEINELNKESIRIKFIGDLSPFSEDLRKRFIEAENITKYNNEFTLNVCTNYGGRRDLVRAAQKLAERSVKGELDPALIDENLFALELFTASEVDPDLLIRTSGEKRISNFLLWQLAYAEIHVTDVLWPDFNVDTLTKALLDYQSRRRRFGGV